MNILLTNKMCVGFMVSEISRVFLFGHCPYSVTFPYLCYLLLYGKIFQYLLLIYS